MIKDNSSLVIRFKSLANSGSQTFFEIMLFGFISSYQIGPTAADDRSLNTQPPILSKVFSKIISFVYSIPPSVPLQSRLSDFIIYSIAELFLPTCVDIRSVRFLFGIK